MPDISLISSGVPDTKSLRITALDCCHCCLISDIWSMSFECTVDLVESINSESFSKAGVGQWLCNLLNFHGSVNISDLLGFWHAARILHDNLKDHKCV